MALQWWQRPIALTEALVAQHTVKLAPEPEGEREGLVRPARTDRTGEKGDARPITLVTVGDSLTVGCGVDRQSDGFVPDMARSLARITGRPVRWQTFGKLGATMRRARFRLLPQVKGRPDLLVLCAGSNDVMARRSGSEWREDLTAAIDEATALSDHVVVISSGQVYRSPALGSTLRRAILDMTDAQTAISRAVCADRGVTFVDMTHHDTGLTDEEFWAYDRFHPSKRCYQLLADGVLEQVGEATLKSL
ncbi:SGNH/GDSL hydrolase family protein [Bifidobacterium avesanii]|uniref:SGNH/GDSL hydrolase family protein n=1 Tax=Bifidobacterium avesanii TaxID=1798157 RepID=A0A7K3TEM7_9BIFI|nr:SGNH/GDSL hydrolase family protein [Bifidobacterium avesanii]KAB8295551.1 GDSL-like lipase/acylhydrolase [Bifidobacterium avesanii]NEG77555.1 SGNH/GDSL hydrolase family protein [Bifidobacterium avesanii]